ncbi:hypothetical protein [Salinarchaeum chitinilyticum]
MSGAGEPRGGTASGERSRGETTFVEEVGEEPSGGTAARIDGTTPADGGSSGG